MENQILYRGELRFDFCESVSLFHDAVKMRRRSVHLVSTQYEIAIAAAGVFKDRAADHLFALGGMAGEW